MKSAINIMEKKIHNPATWNAMKLNLIAYCSFYPADI